MTQREVYEWFKTHFPMYAANAEEWFPNGKSSVRIKLRNGQELIMTYNSCDDWSLETLDRFIKRMKGER